MTQFTNSAVKKIDTNLQPFTFSANKEVNQQNDNNATKKVEENAQATKK
jgi:hypothetical protein